MESIVDEFSELNSRIHENIKLWCLGTSIGVDLRHLRHLESDPNSRVLGFDVDARLQMATSQAEHAASLEIDEWEVGLRSRVKATRVFSLNIGPIPRMRLSQSSWMAEPATSSTDWRTSSISPRKSASGRRTVWGGSGAGRTIKSLTSSTSP